jgi:Skp family chaperone for outer membrane proteins
MKVTLLLAAALLPGLYLTQATGTASVAVIDFDRAVADTSEGKAAIAKLRAFGTERQAAIETKLKEAGELQTRLRNQSTVLSENARNQLTRDLQTAQTELEKMRNDAEERLGQMQQDLLGPVEKKTAAAVNTYAAERGLKIILNTSVLENGLVYVHDTADITTEIIRRIAADLQHRSPHNASIPPPALPSIALSDHLLHSKWLDADFLRRHVFSQATTETGFWENSVSVP